MNVDFEQFVSESGRRLEALCRRVTGDEELGRDAYQEALLQINASLPRFDGKSSLYTWAFRITLNVALNVQRSARRRDAHVTREEAAASVAVAVAETTAEGNPDVGCVQSFRARIVEEALLRLPDAQRIALTLHDLEEMTAAEVASLLAINANAVKQRVHRARGALREVLEREFRARGVAIEALDSIGCVSGLFAPAAAVGQPRTSA